MKKITQTSKVAEKIQTENIFNSDMDFINQLIDGKMKIH